MADRTPKLTPDLVEVFARLVDQARRNYGGLDLHLTEPDASGYRDFSYVEPDAGLHVGGTAATFPAPYRITRLEITPAEGDAEITAGVMKHVSLGAITASLNSLLNMERAEQALEQARQNLDSLPAATSDLIRDAVDQAQPAPAQPRRHHGGREPLTDDHLRDVAVTYLEETGPGKPKKPLERMAAKYDKPEETVRTWVARARKAGWLGPAMKGRAGSEPGPRLLAEMAKSPIASRHEDGTIHVVAPPPEGQPITEERTAHALEAWRKNQADNAEIEAKYCAGPE
jgi:hypothetical protein